jgi:glycine/D-amino acid oxidase-like deaminating enzyme
MATHLDCDLLVVGSGAGGLSAAVTAAWHGLRVIVAEKEAVFGGTAAWSGGWMWAPGNPRVSFPAVRLPRDGGRVCGALLAAGGCPHHAAGVGEDAP